MESSSKTKFLKDRANRLIPGGAHTYSKGDDQFPLNAPDLIDRGLGCRLWDTNDKKYLDLAMSLGTTVLGHAYEPVLEAVRKELGRGVNFCRPSYLEGELAELISEVIPSAEMVKFGKNGSDAVTAAVKLARAFTGRDYVARCSADAFNAIHDWFIGSTVMNRGVPVSVQQLTLKFDYNDLKSCEDLFNKYPGKIAAFLLEPLSFIEPKDGFLEKLLALCEKNGALLIFDEVVSGFRFNLGGAQAIAGVTPHLSAFGKAMANGFAVSALTGKREIMKLGGLDHKSERVFLLSTTHGGETHSLAACIATIKEIQRTKAIEHFWNIGKYMMDGATKIVKEHKAENLVEILGYNCKPAFIYKDKSGMASMAARTLFLQSLLEHDVLMPYFVPSLAHQKSDIDEALKAFDYAVKQLKLHTENDTIMKAIHGVEVKPVFRKFN